MTVSYPSSPLLSVVEPSPEPDTIGIYYGYNKAWDIDNVHRFHPYIFPHSQNYHSIIMCTIVISWLKEVSFSQVRGALCLMCHAWCQPLLRKNLQNSAGHETIYSPVVIEGFHYHVVHEIIMPVLPNIWITNRYNSSISNFIWLHSHRVPVNKCICGNHRIATYYHTITILLAFPTYYSAYCLF